MRVLLGKVRAEDFHMDIHDGSYADYSSCSIVLNGNAILFGGGQENRQISVIHRNGIKRVNNLPFNFEGGICHFNSGTVFLCFDINEPELCRARYSYYNESLANKSLASESNLYFAYTILLYIFSCIYYIFTYKPLRFLATFVNLL